MDQLLKASGSSHLRFPKSNPFATRYIKPGQIPFLFRSEAKAQLEDVANSFCENEFMGQIVGPHGSGKTTLALQIATLVGSHFRNTTLLTIRSVNELRVETRAAGSANHSRLLIVDGIERLPWLHRTLMLRYYKSNKSGNAPAGLLITTHRQIAGLPMIHQTNPSLELFAELVRHLAPDFQVEDEAIKDCYLNHQPNVREALMALYDLA